MAGKIILRFTPGLAKTEIRDFSTIKMMKMERVLFVAVFFMVSFFCKAQISAVTATGEEVILYEDGTWEYVDKSEDDSRQIETNPYKFVKSEDATFLVKSAKTNVGVWLNPKKWKFEKGAGNGDAEFNFEFRGEDLYALIITEKIGIPLETLKKVALQNAKDVSPDIRIIKEEFRNVNGLKVLFMQMNGTIQGVKFSYCGYYFSSENGTVQFLTYTAQNLLNGYLDEIERLLNGLVELD